MTTTKPTTDRADAASSAEPAPVDGVDSAAGCGSEAECDEVCS